MVRQWGQHWLPNSLATPERPDAHPRLTPCLVPKGRLLAAFQLKKAGERDNRWHLDGTDQKSDGRGGSLTRLNRRAHPVGGQRVGNLQKTRVMVDETASRGSIAAN